tara:strand:+ start:1688 stop:1981 length:294 start_codon:yes stop_codon:yes gene_type:complete
MKLFYKCLPQKTYKSEEYAYKAVLDYAGFGRIIIGFPSTPVIWILRVPEFFKLSPLYKWVYETVCEDSFQGKSGLSHRLPWEQGILSIFKTYFLGSH